jgi:hypothetical protein
VSIDKSRLVVDSVIIHDIPERPTRATLRNDPSKDTEPLLSDRPSVLDDRLRRYFETRLVSSLAEAGYPVEFDPDTESPVPDLVAGFLEAQATLVEVSRTMARELHRRQTHATTPGLFAVVTGRIGKSEPYIALMKLEREQGLVIEPIDEDGQMTFAIVLEDDLVLTQRTRVFKTGLFTPDREGDGADGDGTDTRIAGEVSDHQTGFRQTRAVAEFFLGFLGCRLLTQPDLQTQAYFVEAERWINREVSDPVKRARYEQALIADLNSQEERVNPRRWMERTLDVEDRQSFEEAMLARSVPMTSFAKDTMLVKNYLRQVQVSTRDGAKVYAPLKMLEEGRIEISESPDRDGEQKIVVHDEIEQVRGG